MSRYYVTTPIYYINAQPHLGHAYTTLLADAVARAHRLMGQDVRFLTGTDEHGQKVERAAMRAGDSPQHFADQVAAQFRALLPVLRASNDDFVRTTEARHKDAAQALWRRVRERGYIYKDTYSGWYCTVCEVFVPEPQLVENSCPICRNGVERISEESYFFRLSAFQAPLRAYYDAHPEFVLPAARRNEMLAFLDAGLEDLSISRTSFTWGIPVPDDPAHVMYVWFDALANYLTATGFDGRFSAPTSGVPDRWPADVHLIGKEIVRQHAIYWPAFLMAADLPLPRQIASHGWWLMGGAKMSKSVGNVVRPQEYIDQFGVDALRYFVYREMVFGQDASFTDDALLTRYNADLANDLGNLASRVMTLLQRSCGGRIPAPTETLLARDEERTLLMLAQATVGQVRACIDTFQFSVGLRDVWHLIGATNRYIVTREPWKLAKSVGVGAGELETSLYVAADVVRIVAELLRPFLPDTAARLLVMLGETARPDAWSNLAPGQLRAGQTIGKNEILFPRRDVPPQESDPMTSSDPTPSATSAPLAAATASAASTAEVTPSAIPPVAAPITYEEFMKVDLRVARVLAAERVPKSKKLLKLSVDVGAETRTIVAGLADAYEPETLVGRTIAVVFNLAPAKLMGIESQGMVLAASLGDAAPTVVSFGDGVAPGSRIR